MKVYFSFYAVFILIFLLACSEEPPAQQTLAADSLQPAPYLYKSPVTAEAGLPVAKLKNEDLAEAFVTQLSTHKPSGIVVMQQEKLVLEEYFQLDSAALLCTGALFPAYTGALLGSLYKRRHHVPFQLIPLQSLYPTDNAEAATAFKTAWLAKVDEPEEEQLAVLNRIIEQNMQVSQGLAAEELLFEPLQIDDYQWQDESLCLHPHAILKLASLWVKRGRWGNQQILPDPLLQRVLAPAYDKNATAGTQAFGWQYYRLVAKGRKQPVLYWKGQGFSVFLMPEVEAVALLQGGDELMPEAWVWMQDFLIPSLTP